MNSFDKAVEFIEAAKAKNGGYPADLTMVQYDDNHDFQLAFPGEDFKAHCAQIDQLRAWCGERRIKVIMVPFDPELMKGGKNKAGERARRAVTPPWRLGLEMHSTAIGTAIVELSREADAKGFRESVGLGIPAGKSGNK